MSQRDDNTRGGGGDRRDSDEHDGDFWPIYGWYGRHPIPDLNRIPEERWKDALREAHPGVRTMAASKVEDSLRQKASLLEVEVMLQEGETEERARRAAANPERLPVGRLRLPRERRARQVNFRLGPNEYDDLAEAASLLGRRPTQAARILAVRGTQQVLREARRS